MHRMLTAIHPSVLNHLLLPPGTPVWKYLKDKTWHRCIVVEAKQHLVTVRRHKKGPAMALAYEDMRIAPRNEVSVFAEAASLDSPELAIPASSDCGDTDDVSKIDGMTAFLSVIDRQEEEQRLLRQMLDRVGHNQLSLTHATSLTAPWLVDESFTQELVNWKDAYKIGPLNRLPKDSNYIHSHSFYHIKRSISDDSNESLRLKTRIVLQGN
jgi:hypothetical protein